MFVIDGQGGKLGKQIIEGVLSKYPEIELMAVGTNAIATATMLKAGANSAATGENAVVVASKRADVIVGPIGIVIADALLGEITPKMAAAVGASRAERILIPISTCGTYIAGTGNKSLSSLLDDVLDKIFQYIGRN